MTWFHVGGAGIPASLKNAMNAVLNKKFGTTGQNYPPKQWPDDVNLLGPLPIKTASGAIASFSDGADTVPVKSCTVAFGPGGGGGTPADPVALVGYNSVTVKKTGKNLFDKSAVTANTWIIVNDTTTEAATNYSTSDYIRVEAGKRYWVSAKGSNRAAYYDMQKNGITYFSFSGGASFLSQYDGYIRLTYINTTDLNTFIVAEGSTEPTYEAYKGETISDSFGQTVYGGERDMVTDGMKEVYAIHKVTSFSGVWSGTNNPNGTPCYFSIPGATHADIEAVFMKSNMLTFTASARTTMPLYSYNAVDGAATTITICLPNTVTDVASANQWLADLGNDLYVTYKMAAPVDITGLTAHDIETNYADNNFYADIPDSTMTVEYRADIDLMLAALQGSRSLSASLIRSAGPEEESEPEENIQNTEEQEGDNDAR